MSRAAIGAKAPPTTPGDQLREEPVAACGVWAVDPQSGGTLGILRFDELVEEIFDVVLLSGLRWPELSEEYSDAASRSFALPESDSSTAVHVVGRLDLNQRPFGPQPTGSGCRFVRERPDRPLRPRVWTIWTHWTHRSVPKPYRAAVLRRGGAVPAR